jgi:hypothetical protein
MNYRNQEVTGILLCVLALCIFLSFATYSPHETPSGLSPGVARTNIMGLFGIYASYYEIFLWLGHVLSSSHNGLDWVYTIFQEGMGTDFSLF